MEPYEASFVPLGDRKINVAILVVDSFACYCNVCGQEAKPDETEHRTVTIAGLSVPNANPNEVGCNAKFIATTYVYQDKVAGYDANRLRPDLPLISANIER